MKNNLTIAMLLYAIFATSVAKAQQIDYMAHPGGAVTGFDSYGNAYNGTMNPGGTMTMTDQQGRAYTGAVDPFGNGELSR